MAVVVAACSHIFIGGYDFSSDLKSVTTNYATEAQDVTTMGMDTRKVRGGLKTSSFAAKGLLNLIASGNEPILFGNVGVDGTLVTVFQDGVTIGSTQQTGYSMGTMQGSFVIGAAIGTLIPFDITCLNGSLLVKAIPLEDWRSCNFSTGANNGVSYNLGGAATSEQLYAGIHLTALSTSFGANATVVATIQAASSSGAGWTTKATFTAMSSKGGQLLTSPIQPSALSTDQVWYRSVITQSTGSSTGPVNNGLIWMAIV